MRASAKEAIYKPYQFRVFFIYVCVLRMINALINLIFQRRLFLLPEHKYLHFLQKKKSNNPKANDLFHRVYV